MVVWVQMLLFLTFYVDKEYNVQTPFQKLNSLLDSIQGIDCFSLF
jgi:hypothetical protein